MLSMAIRLAERRRLPDWLIRGGIRKLLRRRLRGERCLSPAKQQERLHDFVQRLRRSPVAMRPESANEQHYEVSPAFFQAVLGPRLKYSCCLYDQPEKTLAQAEEAMLELTCRRASLTDGQEILELGCGWGALTLWMAEHYPRSRITAVSNSALQRTFILGEAQRLELGNINVQTADMNDFRPNRTFDRVVSLEMFEHMHNYQELLARISGWLKAEGFLFVHIFTHRDLPYEYQDTGKTDWMARHFFTGGIMPSDQLLLHFQDDLVLDRMWIVDGIHYARTCNHWLEKLDRHADQAREALQPCCGENQADLQLQRWRIFFMACAELFGYRKGAEWHVCHYRFRARPSRETLV